MSYKCNIQKTIPKEHLEIKNKKEKVLKEIIEN